MTEEICKDCGNNLSEVWFEPQKSDWTCEYCQQRKDMEKGTYFDYTHR